MSQFSKKKQLVQSIKESMNKPSPVIKKTNSKIPPSSYSSYLNTAIDYTKDHSVTPYLEPENQVVYCLDSDSPQKQLQQNIPDQQLYDDEIMNEIEMEIYSETKKQSQQSLQQQNQTYEEEQNISYEEQKKYQEPKQKITKNISITGRQKRKVNLKYNNLYEDNEDQNGYQLHDSSYPSKTTKKWTQDYTEDYQQAKIVQQDQQPVIKPKKQLTKPTYEPIHSQPTKKINTPSNIQQPKKFLNFSIDIKLLNNKLKIKRVIKCIADGQAKRRQEARYLVELDNAKNQQKIVGNTEMIHFYKDALIDYYQGLHFS